MGPDFSSRDHAGTHEFFVVLRKKPSITKFQFRAYWKDVHGPLIATVPGIFQYRQVHLGPDEGGIWPRLPNVSVGSIGYDLDGVAELIFLSKEGVDISSEAEPRVLGNDDTNFLQAAAKIPVLKGNNRTVLDRIPEGIHNGSDGTFGALVFLRRRPDINAGDFHVYCLRLSEHIATWRRTLKVRLTNLEPYAIDAGTLEVTYRIAPEHQYQAVLELVFANRLEQRLSFDAGFAGLAEEVSRNVAHVTAHPINARYTFVYDSKPTLLGRHGATIAKLMVEVGATNSATAAWSTSMEIG